MKHYVKPTVEMYSLCGNETICGGCENKLRDNANLNQSFVLFLGAEADVDGDGWISRQESKNLFGSAVDEACGVKVETYCKFTGAINVSWS